MFIHVGIHELQVVLCSVERDFNDLYYAKGPRVNLSCNLEKLIILCAEVSNYLVCATTTTTFIDFRVCTSSRVANSKCVVLFFRA